MKLRLTPYRLLALAGVFTLPSGRAAIVLSEDFENPNAPTFTLPATDPNPAAQSAPFRFDPDDPTRYFGPSDMGQTLNAGISGNAGTYLSAQNMDADAAAPSTKPLQFSPTSPGQLDFAVNLQGNDVITLSIALAGLPGAEPENFIRLVLDQDGDGSYETLALNFAGTGNSAYTDPTYGPLSGVFTTFANLPLRTPTAPDGFLRFRIEVYNDTNGLGEAVGIDSIVINAIPEPSSAVLALGAFGLLGSAGRRRG